MLSRTIITFILIAFLLAICSSFSNAKPLPLNKSLRCGGCIYTVNRMKEEQQKLPTTPLHSKHRIDERKTANPILFNRSEQALYEIFDKITHKDNSKNLAMLEGSQQHQVLSKDTDHRSITNETITTALKYVLSELQQHDEDFIQAFQKGDDDSDYLTIICINRVKYCLHFDFGEIIYTPPPPEPEPEPESPATNDEFDFGEIIYTPPPPEPEPEPESPATNDDVDTVSDETTSNNDTTTESEQKTSKDEL